MNAALRSIIEAVGADLGQSGAGNPVPIDLWGRPFKWSDPATLPARRWLYKPNLIRGFVSVTVAPGGLGKTTLALTEALAVATGRPLLGVEPTERAKVWVFNGEDSADEIQRRVQASMLCHGLEASDVEGWLFTGSGRDADLIVAEQVREGVVVFAPVVDALIAFIKENDIGVVVIDPFVSSHRVAESDNGAIDRVAKTWAKIADATGCAVELIHHTRKTNGREATVEDARGASALHAAARHVRALNVMTDQEADRLGVQRDQRRSYVRVDDGKANLAPPAAHAQWFRLVGVHLGNGDSIQAARLWTPPDPLAEVTAADVRRVQDLIDAGRGCDGEGWRQSAQAQGGAWAGCAVAEALGLDLSSLADRCRVKALLREWEKSGVLTVVRCVTNTKGKDAPFIAVGRRVEIDPPLDQGGG